MRASLHDEVAAFLAERGPSSSPEIATGIRARRGDVDRVLADGGFALAPRREGAHANARFFVSSGRVPRSRGGMSRADVLAEILADGRRHTRAEIYAAAGRVIHTNNAAVELRRRDVDVRYDRSSDSYWIASLAEPETPGPPLVSGSASEAVAVGDLAVSGSALPKSEPERAVAFSDRVGAAA